MRARFFWILGGLLLVVVLGLIGLNFWVRDYLRSNAFRGLVEARTSAALRAEAVYDPFRWTGSTVFSERMGVTGGAGSAIVTAEVRQLRAAVDWRAIFDGAWRVDRMDVAWLDAEVRAPGARPAGVRVERAEAAGAGLTAAGPGWLLRRFEIGEVAVADANFSLPGAGRVTNAVLTIRPEGSGWLFDGERGRLALPGREALEIERFRLRLQQDVLYVTEATLRSGEAGRVDVSGEVGGAKGPFAIRLEWDRMDSAALFSPEWSDRVTGKVSGEVDLVGRDGESALATGRFFLSDGALRGLPIQAVIAKFARSPQFERMPLQEVSGDFVVDGAVTDVRNFVLESQGLLKLEGTVRIGEGGALDGDFQVGVTPQTLQWLPGSQERVFTESRGGYLWTPVRVGGTVERPTEDLSKRLAGATVDEVIETGTRMLEGAPEEARDAVRDVLDVLSPLFR